MSYLQVTQELIELQREMIKDLEEENTLLKEQLEQQKKMVSLLEIAQEAYKEFLKSRSW